MPCLIYVLIDRLGNYLVALFLISKIFYIGNVVGQLFLLNAVLAAKYHTFGIDVVRDMYHNKDWTEQSYVAFPRVTLCDFKVRGQDMVNVHPYTVQCVLPINLYNESIYVFLWYWMVLVAALSVLRFDYRVSAVKVKGKGLYIAPQAATAATEALYFTG